MKIFEIEQNTEGFSNLITLLNFLRRRAHNEGLVGKISFKALTQMLDNIGPGIDYPTFKKYYDNPDNVEAYNSLQNLIKTFDQNSITLAPYGDEDEQFDASATKNLDEPSLNKVDTMAKRALRKRT